MNSKVPRILCASWLLLAPAFAQIPAPTPPPRPTWQEVMALGIVPYHQLTVDDFAINDELAPNELFRIKTAFEPRYHYYLKPDNEFVDAYVDQWLVFSGLRKSDTTRKSAFKDMKASLPYAQALLDISEIHARQLALLKTGELPQGRGDNAEAAQRELEQKMREFIDAKYKATQDEIDAFARETKNGLRQDKVRKLAAEIRRRLEATPNTTVPFIPSAPNETPSPSEAKQ